MNLDNLTREVITPEVAKTYLGMNEGNRKLRKTVVLAYAADMKSGNWNDSPDIMNPIMISREGRLLDGQHRLAAVVNSGVSVVMYVAHDCDDAVFKYLDAGLKRSAGDQLGCVDANLISGIGKRAYCIERGDVPLVSSLGGIVLNSEHGSVTVTRAQTIKYCEEHLEALTSIAQTARAIKKAIGTGTPSTYGTFLWLIEWLERDELLAEFVNDICIIAPQSKTVVAAKATIQRVGMDKSTTVTDKWLMGTLLCAYDHYCAADDSVMFNKSTRYLGIYNSLVQKKRKRERE